MKCGGEFYGDTAYNMDFVHYDDVEYFHRPPMMRRSTSLKLEGEMVFITEQCDKFIEYLNVVRPQPFCLPTNLRLEGEHSASTENLDKYVPFTGVRRPDLIKHKTQLKIEGENSFCPEYRDAYKDYGSLEGSSKSTRIDLVKQIKRNLKF